MKYVTILVFLLISPIINAQEEPTTIITKSITIINGDTLVNEEAIEVDGEWLSQNATAILRDTFTPGNHPFNIDSLLGRGLGDLKMFFGSIDGDSIFKNLDIQFHDFSDNLNLDSLLGTMEGRIDQLDLRNLDLNQLDWFGENDSESMLQSNFTIAEKLEQALNRDGLLLPNRSNEVTLSGKSLKINGDKQPENIYAKYKAIWESHTGLSLAKKDKITMRMQGAEYKRNIKKD